MEKRVLKTGFIGGIRLDWDDIDRIQLNIADSLAILCAGLFSAEDVVQISEPLIEQDGFGYGFFDYHSDTNEVIVTESNQVFYYKGEVLMLGITSNQTVSASNLFWIEPVETIDPDGNKTTIQTNIEYSTWVSRKLKVSWGSEYPTTDYFPLEFVRNWKVMSEAFMPTVDIKSMSTDTGYFNIASLRVLHKNGQISIYGTVLRNTGNPVALILPPEYRPQVDMYVPVLNSDMNTIDYCFISGTSGQLGFSGNSSTYSISLNYLL